MNRKLVIPILMVSFGFSSVNAGLAAQIVELPPVVQPYAAQDLNQLIEREGQNVYQEQAISALIEENNALARTALANHPDQELEKLNQTLLSYRQSLLARDRSRVMGITAGGSHRYQSIESWGDARYGDLIALSKDADGMTVHQDLTAQNGLLAQRYQMLTALKDAMTALNDKLKDRVQDGSNQKQSTLEGFKTIAQEQQIKIQSLVEQLGAMDKKIAHFDEILAEKDHQISQLQRELARLRGEVVSKDEMIRQQQGQIDVLLKASGNLPVPEVNRARPAQEVVYSVSQLPASPVNGKDLVPVVANAVSHPGQDYFNTPAELMELKTQTQAQSEELKAKDESIRQLNELFAKTNGNPDQQAQMMALNKLIQTQSDELKARDESIRWLNKVLAAAKTKAEFYKITAQQNQLSIDQVRGQVRDLQQRFDQSSGEYDQFEKAIVTLKGEVTRLDTQLAGKQEEVNQLKAQLQARPQRVALCSSGSYLVFSTSRRIY